MAFISIKTLDGKHDLPLPPCKRGVHITVSSVVDSARNANGVVIGQRVCRDLYKIDGLEWPWLTAQQWSDILTIIKSFRFYVTFTNPVTNKLKTVRMYCGDRDATPYWVDEDGKPTHYRDCKVNFIDTGE